MIMGIHIDNFSRGAYRAVRSLEGTDLYGRPLLFLSSVSCPPAKAEEAKWNTATFIVTKEGKAY